MDLGAGFLDLLAASNGSVFKLTPKSLEADGLYGDVSSWIGRTAEKIAKWPNVPAREIEARGLANLEAARAYAARSAARQDVRLPGANPAEQIVTLKPHWKPLSDERAAGGVITDIRSIDSRNTILNLSSTTGRVVLQLKADDTQVAPK
jgi:hypothetical protein